MEDIRGIRQKRRGRGLSRQVLVKWAGYAKNPHEKPLLAIKNTEALNIFEAKYSKVADLEDFTVGKMKIKKQKKRGKGRYFSSLFFSGFDFFLGGGYYEDLHPWVRHVVIPLTCGYTWSSMWLLFSPRAYLVTPPGTPLLIVSYCPSIVYMFSV